MKIRITLISILLLQNFANADVWTFSTDNDLFFQSDDAYTAGGFLSWMGDEYSQSDKDSFTYTYTSTLKSIVTALPLVDLESKKLNAAISLQEIMITPNDLSQEEPIYTDMPYSGTFAMHLSLFAWDKHEFDEYRVSMGVVGPLSGAEQLQSLVHTITGSTEAMGWDNQLGNHFYLNLGYLKGMKSYEYKLNNTTRFEWFNSYYFDVGNYYIGAGAGTLIRIGQNMPNNFNASSTLISISPTNNLNFASRNDKFGWSANLGINGDLIGYMYLQDAARDAGYDVQKQRWLINLTASVDVYYENMRASLELFPSRGSVNDDSTSWGRISFTWYLN